MNPTDQWFSTSTVPMARERAAVRMLDTVKVGADTFKSVMFMSATARKEFVQGSRVRDEDKPQKRTADGMPLWSVQVAAINWRGKSELVSVTVPTHDNPADKFQAGDPVRLSGLVFGVTAKRDGGGFVTWCSADGIDPASGGVHKAAAAS